jgi:general secretion pathway protein K
MKTWLRICRTKAERGSVILIVLITILFATSALTLFIEKASNDLLVDAREADADRLRIEAYSALETTLGVLEDFRSVIGQLHSPAEGWGAPLLFAGYTPGEGRTVEVAFQDESAKISLPNADAPTLISVFKSWNIPQATAEKLADALLGWMKKDYVPSTASAPRAEDYDRGELPFVPAERPLRSFSELATIEYVRDLFFDENGEPTPLYQQFVNSFSLYSYKQPNINGGNPAALAGIGIEDSSQWKRVSDYLSGSGALGQKGSGYFKDGTQVAALLGGTSPAAQMSTQISALRVIITVHEGRASFRLNTVVAPKGGARLPALSDRETKETTAQPQGETASSNAAVPAQSTQNAKSNSESKSLNYPFTILEIRENDETPAASVVGTP